MSNGNVRSRLAFMGLDDRQCANLAKLRPLISGRIGAALDRFYQRARVTPETAAFFRDDAQMAKAKAAQEAHWLKISSATFDDDFYSGVRRIGTVHARIGLEPRWYIGAYAIVLDKLLLDIGRACAPWRRLLGGFRTPNATDAGIALVKAALLDMELSVSIYFEEAQVERDCAIETLNTALERLAAGNLASELNGMPASFAALERNYNATIAAMRTTIGAVSAGAESIRTGSTEISQASEDLARRTESNAASLEQTSAALVQIESRIRATALAAEQTVKCANQATATVGSGRVTTGGAVQAMGRVSDSAKGIDSVLEGLDKIAFQTRVLAMNAAVEAGRAGDAGRGFAVVADLVSALAMRAEEEAKRARGQLTVTQSEIGIAVAAVEDVGAAFTAISSDVDQVQKLLGGIADDNLAQSAAITQITAAIGSMDQATQQNAAMVEQTSAAARNLTTEVVALTEQAGRFDIGNDLLGKFLANGATKSRGTREWASAAH
ncbi:globin-coupled sensor protein [soil metagenome]